MKLKIDKCECGQGNYAYSYDGKKFKTAENIKVIGKDCVNCGRQEIKDIKTDIMQLSLI